MMTTFTNDDVEAAVDEFARRSESGGENVVSMRGVLHDRMKAALEAALESRRSRLRAKSFDPGIYIRNMLEPERQRLFERSTESDDGFRFGDSGVVTVQIPNADAREILAAIPDIDGYADLIAASLKGAITKLNIIPKLTPEEIETFTQVTARKICAVIRVRDPEWVYKIGDAVSKKGGDYRFDGDVVTVFRKLSGLIRLVVEDDRGLLHIYSEGNLQPRNAVVADT
jgi:hypothetical protein